MSKYQPLQFRQPGSLAARVKIVGSRGTRGYAAACRWGPLSDPEVSGAVEIATR